MLYWVAKLLTPYYSGFHAFSYITLRAILSVMTALSMALLVGPRMISRLSSYQIGQVVRDDGPRSHLPKAGTPTMGGVLIIVAIVVSTLLWSDLRNRFVWITLGVTVGFGVVGFWDDYLKLVVGNSRGLAARWKYFWQSVLGFSAALLLYRTAQVPAQTDFFVPFIKSVNVPLGSFGYVALSYFMIVGMSNAVNLTDGLDGLAIMPTAMVSGALGIFAYASGNIIFANYLSIPAIPQAGEVLIFCGALSGAGLGFLWFNAPPAAVFMGDTGSLALGGALGAIAVVAHHEIVLGIVGGLFVVEAMSVIIQVFFYKRTGKRVFKMAPIHHHFEQIGWSEPTVVIRFWIVALVLAMVGLATLKLR